MWNKWNILYYFHSLYKGTTVLDNNCNLQQDNLALPMLKCRCLENKGYSCFSPLWQPSPQLLTVAVWLSRGSVEETSSNVKMKIRIKFFQSMILTRKEKNAFQNITAVMAGTTARMEVMKMIVISVTSKSTKSLCVMKDLGINLQPRTVSRRTLRHLLSNPKTICLWRCQFLRALSGFALKQFLTMGPLSGVVRRHTQV